MALMLFAAACGTALSDEEAASELRAQGGAAGVQAGGSGGATGPGSAEGDLDLGEVGGADLGSGAGAEGGAGGTDGGAAGASGDSGAAGGSGETAGANAGGGSGDAAAADLGRSNGEATDVGVTGNEIRVGWVGTMTGPVPGLFRGALVATQAWANYQNSQGGIMGRKIRVVPADDSLDSGKNRAAHLQLKDKVFAFVGSFSVNDDGGAPVVTQCECPDITGNLSEAMHNSPSHYGPQPAEPGWQSGPPRYFAKKYGEEVITKLAFFYSQVPAAEAHSVQQRRVYEEAGFEVVYTRGVPPNDNNQTADVIQMQRAGVRAIVFQGDLTSYGKLVTAMSQQNFTVDLLNLGGAVYDSRTWDVMSPSDLQNLEVNVVRAMFLGEDAERIPEVALFNEWMEKTDPNQSVDLFATYGWLSGRLFTDAMTKMAGEGKQPVRADLLQTLGNWGEWDGYGMVAPVNIGKKEASDCFFVFTATEDARFRRTYPQGQPFSCGDGPFSTKP